MENLLSILPKLRGVLELVERRMPRKSPTAETGARGPEKLVFALEIIGLILGIADFTDAQRTVLMDLIAVVVKALNAFGHFQTAPKDLA